MAYSAVKGALLNVKVNLKYIEDENYKSDMENKIGSLKKSTEKVFKTIIEGLESFFSS